MVDRILVVDDDPLVREVLLRFLEREGYEPVPAGSGEEALEILHVAPPDLVLLDVQLPGIDGYAVCRRIKENEATALIPVTILTGVQDAEARTNGIEAGADDFITKPFEYGLLRARVRAQLRIKRLTDQLESTEMVVFSMARWVESKDSYTEGHLRRIAGYSEQTAAALGLPPEQRRVIRFAGVLHDIGKIGVPGELLRKPGRLTAEEEREVRKHAEFGAAIVAPMRFAGDVAPIILAHHEHWDGGGYPYGLRGEQIPLGARIIAVVDAYDAMTSDRPYRASLGNQEAVRRLEAGTGTQWDPRVVAVFLELLRAGQLRPGELPGSEPVVGHRAFYPSISGSDRHAA
jgi:cyclic di-GMP phosphodiesterase